MAWFGKVYNAPVYKDTPFVATPVGKDCFYCEEVIGVDDDGFIDASGNPFHRECFLRLTIGSVEHQLKICSCHLPENIAVKGIAGMSRRRAAQAAVKLFEMKSMGEWL